MRQGSIAVISHVNPFSTGSGQIQRVYNTLLALAEDWEFVTIYTLEKSKSKTERVLEIHSINPNLKIIYIEYPILLPLLNPFFHLFPYFGAGKASNWVLPFIFRKINKSELVQYDIILFEYWHLYNLAASLKKSGGKVICDTHNILQGSYKEYLAAKKWMPNFYRNFLIRKYKTLEFDKALRNSFTALISINLEEDKILRKKLPRVKIIYCPMGIKFYDKVKLAKERTHEDIFTVIYYGSLGSSRNASAAIEVYDALFGKQDQITNIRYKIIGANPPESLVKKVSQNSMVSITGYIENLSDALYDADLAVIPFEGKYGFRSRLIELMYHQIPVMTTKDAVWGMGFTDGEDVFIYNDRAKLSDEIRAALAHKEKRSRIARQAAATINREYSFENTYQRLSKEIRDI